MIGFLFVFLEQQKCLKEIIIKSLDSNKSILPRIFLFCLPLPPLPLVLNDIIENRNADDPPPYLTQITKLGMKTVKEISNLFSNPT